MHLVLEFAYFQAQWQSRARYILNQPWWVSINNIPKNLFFVDILWGGYFWIQFLIETWFRLKKQGSLSEALLRWYPWKIQIQTTDNLLWGCSVSANHMRDETSLRYSLIVKWTEPFKPLYNFYRPESVTAFDSLM